MEAAFLALMPDTVTVVAPTYMDVYGRREWTGAFTDEFTDEFGGMSFRCRVEDEEDLLGEVSRAVKRKGRAYLYGAAEIEVGSLLILPDGYEPRVVAVQQFNDGDGPHHTVLVWEG